MPANKTGSKSTPPKSAKPTASKKNRPGRPKAPPDPRAWMLWGILGLVGAALAAVVLVALVFPRSTKPTPKLLGHVGEKVPASIMRNLTTVPYKVWGPIGTAAAAPPQLVKPVAHVPKAPELLYIGAEWCPFCAAERWAMAVALSRFGTLSNLHLMQSSLTDIHPGTKTLTFYHSRYQSSNIHIAMVETATNTHTALQAPTAAQAAIQAAYDKPPYVPSGSSGSIPFVLVGGKYLWIGAQYQPTILAGLSWSQIAADVKNPSSSVGQTILSAANELTAAICATDGGHPASVCQTPVIRGAESRL